MTNKFYKMKKGQTKRQTLFNKNNFAFGVTVMCTTFLLLAGILINTLGFQKIALISSCLAMPQGTIDYIMNDVIFKSQKEEDAQLVNLQDKSFAEEIHSAEQTTQSKSNPNDLKSTPDDILSLMAQYKKEHKNDKSGGEIIEQTFKHNGATHSYKNIYVKNITETKKLNIEKVLNEKVDMKIEDKTKPTVLIFHTHTTEAYEILDRGFYTKGSNGRSFLADRSVVRVGDEIEKSLKESGFCVIHDKQVHDKKYTGAYDKSRITVTEYLKKYPSIQVVLDVHRDAIHPNGGKKIKPVTTIDGKKSAQVMIITGAEEGNVKNFPDWEYNLRFALKMQKACTDMYPTLMRPVLFTQRKYVMDLSHCNILLEMGSDVNTLEESAYAGRLIGKALASMMEEYVV